MRSNQETPPPTLPRQTQPTQASPGDDRQKLTPRAEQVISRDLVAWAATILVQQGGG
jgi:hypothetical protein